MGDISYELILGLAREKRREYTRFKDTTGRLNTRLINEVIQEIDGDLAKRLRFGTGDYDAAG